MKDGFSTKCPYRQQPSVTGLRVGDSSLLVDPPLSAYPLASTHRLLATSPRPAALHRAHTTRGDAASPPLLPAHPRRRANSQFVPPNLGFGSSRHVAREVRLR
uniref:Uncharacterized protein n=1 Tax=Oryza sativa subsp. japonica TaxID=39947 RepID=Q6K783_ORYSJ|nr:hypothetical protein [Oryza sativa Japonica Group]